MRIPTRAGYAATAALLAATLAPASAGIVRHTSGFGQATRIPIPLELRLGAAGLRPSPILPGAMQRGLSLIGQRPSLKFNPNANVGLWVTDTNWGYIVGQTSNGLTTVSAINTVPNGCSYPIGIKVDHAKNLWAACESNSSFANGVIQVYAPGSSTPTTQYQDTGCAPHGCRSFSGLSVDVAFDNHHHAFASNFSSNYCPPGPSCDNHGSVSWWKTTSPSAAPTVIVDPNLSGANFMDVDHAGNVYVDGNAVGGGVELDMITSPTHNPTISVLIPPGTIQAAGGVYVSRKVGVDTLNVTDQISRTITRYPIPFGASTGVLGPTPTNILGQGDPVSGGFNKTDTLQAEADGYGWLDIGNVASNQYTAVASFNFNAPEGAAYVPSDK